MRVGIELLRSPDSRFGKQNSFGYGAWHYIPFAVGNPCPFCQAGLPVRNPQHEGFYARVDVPCDKCGNTRIEASP